MNPQRLSWQVKLALGLVILLYVVYSSFGVAGPYLWGHFGHHGAEYTARARMTLRWHMITPATFSGYEVPPKSFYYLHHPIGYHHILVPFMWLLGDGTFVGHGVPALGGLLLLWALFTLVRHYWGPWQGVLATLLYVTLPILCSFSILTDPMLLAMAASLATVYCFLRYQDDPSGRWLRNACLCYVAGGLLMWEAYFQALFHGVFALLWALWWRAHGQPRRFGASRWDAGVVWFLVTGVASAATMSVHGLFLWGTGTIGDFFSSYQVRHAATLAGTISAHRRWIDLLYGSPPLWLAGLWAVIFAVRVVSGRARARDQAVLLYWMINTLYIALFAAGSAVHLYRVFFYSSFLALAAMDVLCDLGAVAARLSRRRQAQVVVTLLGAAAYLWLELPHSYHNLIESREMMGTHGQPGYNAEQTKFRFAEEMARRMTPADFSLTHMNLVKRIEWYYYMDFSYDNIYNLQELAGQLKRHPRMVLALDAAATHGSEREALRELVKSHPSYLYDHYLMIDLRPDTKDPPGLRMFVFKPQAPSWAYRWFVSHKYPPLAVQEVQRSPFWPSPP